MMKREASQKRLYLLALWTLVAALLLAVPLLCSAAWALTINVEGSDGMPVTEFRWLVEEDAGYHPDPNVQDPNTLAVSFHRSYMPVVAKGDELNSAGIALDPSMHYFVSVLPKQPGTYSIGGAQVDPGQDNVTVFLNALPLPTAQITIIVFEDTFPVNGALDQPQEMGLEGFSILLEDAGGRYGMSAGMQSQDAFANPLGTTYQRDDMGNFILNPDGSPVVRTLGSGVILTDVNGEVTIKNLAPGKYGIQAVPPAGQGWQQTSTIEGTKVIDAWVKANEPPFFQEFGPPGYHVFIGFIKPMNDTTVLTGGSTVEGQVVNLHLSRPPDYAFYNGGPFAHTTPWVGLNLGATGEGRAIFAQRANSDGTFSIPNVPPGDYQLVVWDDNLDLIIAFSRLTVNPDGSCATPGGSCDLGDVPVFQWYSRLENWAFYDADQDGYWGAGDGPGMLEQAVNVRWRDATMYQSFPTDGDGFVPFDQVFPFFSWLVAEVDFARFKATGLTVVVDNGGPINPADPWSFGGQLNPQPQSENGNLPFRTETGPVLTEAFQGFIGQTSVLMWGKAPYGPGENGGISGIVYYATTRAEDDPRQAAAEPWEPGIPRVQVNLYQDANDDGVIDDINGTPGVQLADVDNYPFDWSGGGVPGPEDEDRDLDGVFDVGDALQVATTDSWDDSPPTGCQGDSFILYGQPTDCYDGLRNFNQMRPGVFDGGYAFNGLVSGIYIVEAVPPPGYELVKEEDRNVDFGDELTPGLLMLPPECVGDPHPVPAELSLFPGVPGAYANMTRPLCDRKKIYLSNGLNAAADFFLFTEVPIAAHAFGFILDDTTNEFRQDSPQFGEKYAPPFLPVSFRDWTGREVARTVSDEFGRYNALLPSTYTTNMPAPSGMSPSMITACMNDAGPIPDPDNPGHFITDPLFNRQYSQFCYTFQYMPGTTTYLDTPVVPVAAFAGVDQFPVDCQQGDGTPGIYSVSGPEGGPYVPSTGDSITIVSQGAVEVPNPAYEGAGTGTSKTIFRDYAFGDTEGTVSIGGVPLTVTAWTPDAISAVVPAGVETGQLMVIRGDNGKPTVSGITVTVGPLRGGRRVIHVSPSTVAGATPIQDAIDQARPADLILVAPGVYDEMVIMWKPVQLQGWGAGSTTINARKVPAEKLLAWRQKVELLYNAGVIDLLPGQEALFGGGIETGTLQTEEGAGILVLARDTDKIQQGGFVQNPHARIDGISITGADVGGALAVNAYARFLEISNMQMYSNQGFYGGGIRVGHPFLVREIPTGLQYDDAQNEQTNIHHNLVVQNGGLGGAGGGISLHTGAKAYQVSQNFICGNFTLGDGGGIGHLGMSHNGVISGNTIVFNENFNQGSAVHGGGIAIMGGPPLNGPGDISEGSGTVWVVGNLLQGNAAGAGDGGALYTSRVNGQEVLSAKKKADAYAINVFNNMMVNNVAALAGGGISLHDTASIQIVHNTIANNDSTATAGEAFAPGSPNESTPQPAGIVSHAHSPELVAALPAGLPDFSDPTLVDNVVWHNRSFSFFGDPNAVPPVPYALYPDPATPVFWDLAVLGTAAPETLNPMYCVLSDTTGYDVSNLSGDPAFVAEYYNGDRGQTIIDPEVTTSIQAPPAFDEGGNFIRLRFGPLTLRNPATGDLFGDYHITAGSSALDAGTNLTGTNPVLATDYDGEPRPSGAAVDIGADEMQQLLGPLTGASSAGMLRRAAARRR